ncbi:MAG: hypothetical protein C5B49_03115 [Bdellovibrio sp.]|nr:MAG: hypothetical protein C5B49_03115 [Bdellovibrio sp.]
MIAKTIFTSLIFAWCAGTSAFATEVEAENSGLSGEIRDCPSKEKIPFMSVRNLIPDSRVTSIVAVPMSGYKYSEGQKVGMFLSVVAQYIMAQKISVLKKPVPGESMESLKGEEGDEPNCGSDMSFSYSAWFGEVYPKTCSINQWENIYQLTVTIEKNKDRQPHTITMTKNICTETMFDILPGTPTDDTGSIDYRSRISAPHVDDCPSTNGKLQLNVRNLIPETRVVDVKARSYANFNFETKTWDSAFAKEGRKVLNKSFKNEDLKAGIESVDPASVLKKSGDAKNGYCGVPMHLVRGNDSDDCDADHDNKWNNVFELVFTLQRPDGSLYSVNYTRDACRETVLDITQGTPATKLISNKK